MESFNKNWLAVLLIATIFFLLGFLIAKTCKPCAKKCNRKANSCHVEKARKCGSKKGYHENYKKIEEPKESSEN